MEIRVVTMIDEGLLDRLERFPANKVLALLQAVTEQVRASVSFVRQEHSIPGDICVTIFDIEGIEVLSVIEDRDHIDPRTHQHIDTVHFLVNVLSFMPSAQEES